MPFSPQLFYSNINAKEGLAKPSRFEIVLPIPKYINEFIGSSFLEKLINLPNNVIADISDIVNNSGNLDPQSRSDNASMSGYLALQCESAELPGKMLQTMDAKVYGPTFKVPYQTQYTDTSLTFLCTNEFYERKLFDRWIESIMPSDTNNLRYPKGEKSRYLTNIKVIQYDDFIQQIFAVELMDAFPIGFSSQPLSWSEDTFHRLTVQFAYQKYRVLYNGKYDLATAAAALFGVKASTFFNRIPATLERPLGTIFNNII
jgi:hypothetical protein